MQHHIMPQTSILVSLITKQIEHVQFVSSISK